MTGLPVEELLARVGRRDMPARLSLLDHLCLFIDNLHAHIREEHLQYFRWKVMMQARGGRLDANSPAAPFPAAGVRLLEWPMGTRMS